MAKKVNAAQVVNDLSQLNDGAGMRFLVSAYLPKRRPEQPNSGRPDSEKDISSYTPDELQRLQHWSKYDRDLAEYTQAIAPIQGVKAARQVCNAFLGTNVDEKGNRYACIWLGGRQDRVTLPLTGYNPERAPGAQRLFIETIIEEMRLRAPTDENTRGAVCTAYVEDISDGRVYLNLLISANEKKERADKEAANQEAQEALPEMQVPA